MFTNVHGEEHANMRPREVGPEPDFIVSLDTCFQCAAERAVLIFDVCEVRPLQTVFNVIRKLARVDAPVESLAFILSCYMPTCDIIVRDGGYSAE